MISKHYFSEDPSESKLELFKTKDNYCRIALSDDEEFRYIELSSDDLTELIYDLYKIKIQIESHELH